MPPRLTQETLRKATVYVGETNRVVRFPYKAGTLAAAAQLANAHRVLAERLPDREPDMALLAGDHAVGAFRAVCQALLLPFC